MKTTNTNNSDAAIEATASENSYIATKVRTEVWEERTGIDISTFECTGMAAVTEMFAHNNEGLYVVTNLATGEKRTYGSNEFRKWCTSQTIETMVDYRITVTVVWNRASLHGRGEITHEIYFTRAKRSDVDADAANAMYQNACHMVLRAVTDGLIETWHSSCVIRSKRNRVSA